MHGSTEVLSVEELSRVFERFLRDERGLAPATVRGYSGHARRFAAGVGGVGVLAGLGGAAVEDFVLRYAARTSPATAAAAGTGLRVFLRWACQAGLAPAGLDEAVPRVAAWRCSGTPKAVSSETVEAVLAGAVCGREPLRDRAALLLMARLGLRGAEVARLRLEDVDWAAGTVAVRGKARRFELLPLLGAVGEALARYLRSRPAAAEGVREVFTWGTPGRALSPDQVRDLTRRACKAAGVAPFGTHRLRHSLATSMLAAGVGLEGIGQVLRHRSAASTAVYAKCDFGSLVMVARPWPGAER
jgi:site-specific recombinase XerC